MLNNKLADNFKSLSQKIRVITEYWVNSSVFCPNCGCEKIEKFPNNQPVADFHCPHCDEEFELKSKNNIIGSKILDGAYSTMIERLNSSNNPNFFLLNYNLLDFSIHDFFVIPKHFFIPEIIEKRKPLAQTARRAGWVGCNILLKGIPNFGKIFFIKGGIIEPKEKVLAEWKKTLFLREKKEISAKGWLLDVLRCLEKIGRTEFTLEDVYIFESELSSLHPENRHVKEKIRQQLQILRDSNFLSFVSRGIYHLN